MTLFRIIGLALSLLMLTACATSSSKYVPSASVAPRASESESFNAWLNGVVQAYVENCIKLRVMAHEDPAICRDLVK